MSWHNVFQNPQGRTKLSRPPNYPLVTRTILTCKNYFKSFLPQEPFAMWPCTVRCKKPSHIQWDTKWTSSLRGSHCWHTLGNVLHLCVFLPLKTMTWYCTIVDIDFLSADLRFHGCARCSTGIWQITAKLWGYPISFTRWEKIHSYKKQTDSNYNRHLYPAF